MTLADYRTYLDLLPAVRQSPQSNVWLYYDIEADTLYVNFKKPSRATDSELTDDDVIIRYDEGEIVGFTILHASRRMKGQSVSEGIVVVSSRSGKEKDSAVSRHNEYHVRPRQSGDWEIRKSGGERASRVLPTKQDAERAGREIAKKQGAELIIHRKDGSIEKRDSHGSATPPQTGNKPNIPSQW